MLGTGPKKMSELANSLFCDNSNVTGIVSDTRAVAALLHRHGALSFWDYAAAAPYVPIRMRPRSS
jgi:selenocysteine lyase/cysteine desulfurase